MKIRLYLDEDVMNAQLVQALRARGTDVTSVRDSHKEGCTDEEQLEYAMSEGRTLYSFNTKHYMALHTHFLEEGRTHFGIILAEQHRRYSVGEQMRRLLILINTISAEEIKGQVFFLSNWG